MKNDLFKNELAKNKGYRLKRFWEDDIIKIDFEIVLLETINKYEKIQNIN